jgi:glutamate--cysteine ligase
MRSADLGQDDWLFHLSTLFPEVRPKEFFEIRSPDAIELQHLAAPLVFVLGLVYDDESAISAARLLGAPSELLLERAGRLGVTDPEIRRILPRLTELALDGARRLGTKYLSATDVLTAGDYFAWSLGRADI